MCSNCFDKLLSNVPSSNLVLATAFFHIEHTHAAYFMRLFQELCLQSDYLVKMLMLQLYNSGTNFYHFPLYLSLYFLSFIYHITRRIIVTIIRHHHHNYQEYYSQFLITIIAINLNISVNIIIYINVFVLTHDLTSISIAIKTITIIIIDIVFIVIFLRPSPPSPHPHSFK